jgi:hypothetical protein
MKNPFDMKTEYEKWLFFEQMTTSIEKWMVETYPAYSTDLEKKISDDIKKLKKAFSQ